MARQIIAMGGGVLVGDSENRSLERYVIAASNKDRPRALFIGTASGDDAARLNVFYEAYGALGCATAHLPFFRRTAQDIRALVLGQDIVHVGGGNTRTMFAVWREWGLTDILQEAYERGIVLCGSSAGSICWYEEGVTDSVAGDLGLIKGLGLLPGSHCPHYDAEPQRRPAYQRFVAAGTVSPGIAADDGVALHYVDGKLEAIVRARPNVTAYKLERDGDGVRETRLEARDL